MSQDETFENRRKFAGDVEGELESGEVNDQRFVEDLEGVPYFPLDD